MELVKAKRMARYYINKYLSKKWKIEYVQDKEIYGECDDAKKIIRLSLYFLKKNTRENVRDTILHEISHGMIGTEHGHNREWQKLAESLSINPKMHFKPD